MFCSASRRHDWASFVAWIDNPGLENPRLLGVSVSKTATKCDTETQVPEYMFAGYQRRGMRSEVSNTSVRAYYSNEALLGPAFLTLDGRLDGEYQDLIMWEQLPNEARAALTDDNFDDSRILFNDENFDQSLSKAWPF
ncbi:unnamed protein product [Phytophthora lilii]|uniref:Unnamed protein product n=1 Tax=Phytophthora lilii TaxID=2077276 RepID=A0A9W6TF30_9STRA|nr:unnamed protein product [Phytophthora lilii]